MKNIFKFLVIALLCIFVFVIFAAILTPDENVKSDESISTQQAAENPVNLADKKFVNGLKDILNKDYSVVNDKVYVTKSNDFKNMFFFGALVQKNGQFYNAIWVTNDVSSCGAGLVYSVNDYAVEASGIGDSRTNKEPITENDDGYSRINQKLLNDMNIAVK